MIATSIRSTDVFDRRLVCCLEWIINYGAVVVCLNSSVMTNVMSKALLEKIRTRQASLGCWVCQGWSQNNCIRCWCRQSGKAPSREVLYRWCAGWWDPGSDHERLLDGYDWFFATCWRWHDWYLRSDTFKEDRWSRFVICSLCSWWNREISSCRSTCGSRVDNLSGHCRRGSTS